METFLPFIFFFISIVVLIRSGSTIVVRLSRIARFFRISEFIAAFVFISVATSLPDFFVGILSAIHGTPELSFSNIIGANIATLTIATGLAAIIGGGLLVDTITIRREILYAAFGAFLPVLIFLDGAVSRVDGAVLVVFAAWYFIRLMRQSKRFPEEFSDSKKIPLDFKGFVGDFFVLLIAAAFLIVGAEGVIRSAISIASSLEVPISIIGILLVALSITLPEIVFGMRAVMMGHKDMVLGNVIGSVIVNSGFVIGPTAIIAPIRADVFHEYTMGIAFTIVGALVFAVFAYAKKKISVLDGLIMAALYIIFVLSVFLFDGRII